MNYIKYLRAVYLLLGIYFLLTIPAYLWYLPVLGYFIISICNGVAGHRYFAHEQFSVNTVGRTILGLMATVGMYSPINYWIVQHKHHHRHSDNDRDVHSPMHGFWHAFALWPFKTSSIESVFRERSSLFLLARANKDRLVADLSKYFVLVNLIFASILIAIDYKIFCYLYLPGVLLDYIRIGLVNTVCHLDVVGNYKNHTTKDSSSNNLWLGILGLGFGWHNNHHNDAGRLILTERWWELDIEGQLGKLFSVVFKP